MNTFEYNTVVNELLPRFMHKLGKFLTYDNDGIASLCWQLDHIEKYKTASDSDVMNLHFNLGFYRIPFLCQFHAFFKYDFYKKKGIL